VSTDDPRRQGVGAPPRDLSFVALDEARAFARHERTPLPIEPYVAAVDEAVERLAERAKVPAWVLNPEKWQSLSRVERRATVRHHEREQRRARRGR
jgi:hypothetical protein